MANNRYSNIELLRIILMMGVISLHINFEGIGGAFKYVTPYSTKGCILYFIEAMWLCAVNTFMIICGYFSSKRTRAGIKKPLLLLSQLIVYRVAIYIVNVLLGIESFGVLVFVSKFLPANYFIVLYIVLYLFSPYLNKLLLCLGEKELKQLVVLLLVIFSLYTTTASVVEKVLRVSLPGVSSIGIEGNEGGYTIVHFSLMYIVGVCLRRFDDKITNRKATVISGIAYLTSVMILAILLVVATNYNMAGILYNYDQPLVVLNSVSVFVFFRNLKIRDSVAINKIAGGCFGIYLLQSTLIHRMNTETIVQRSPLTMCFILLLYVIGIFSISWIADFVYNHTIKYAFERIPDKVVVDLNGEC